MAGCKWLLFGVCASALVGLTPSPSLAPQRPKQNSMPPEEAVESIEMASAEAHRAIGASTSNLRQMVIAWHNYASVNNDHLAQNIVDKNGKALLSWRVQLLPFLEEEELYKLFKLDEPWD